MKRFFSYIIVLTFLLNISYSQQLVEGVLVVVGNEVILKTEVDQYLQSYILQNKIDAQKNPEIVEKLRKQTIEHLIDQKLMLVKAEEDTITIEEEMLDSQVDQRIRYMIDQVGSEDKLESLFGSSMKKIRKDTRKILKEQMLVEKVRSEQFRAMKISRREVEEFYEMYQDSLPVRNESVEIAHILKLIKPSAEAQAKAYQEAESVLQQINAGADFAELAMEHSDDQASAKRGGDLGLMSRGDFVPEFEAAAFQLEDGQISGIVQTQFGYHIIKMIERRGEKVHTQHILIQTMPNEDDENRTIEELKEIRKQYLEGGDFSELVVKNSDDENVSQDKGNLGVFETNRMAIPQFKEIVDQLKPGEVSDPFRTEYGYHIVLLKARNKPRPLDLENDWQQIEQMALNYKMEKEYRNWIQEMRKTINIEVRDLS
ncbi:MAG: peptidylprolyl isomerase [Calditrichaceae bacterium]|nr:peptidylprolyl isomerase [Calditrichaceae bacterium]RQV94696.1 MAG: hypothetical protein EH224_09765 [Calditrichota bacterium]